jgi:hypothetical protein
MNSIEPSLPDLQNAVLDIATVDQLFRDIQQCTEVLEIIPKYSQHGYVPEGVISLSDARTLLINRQVRAVQLRYRYQEAQWWDTVMVVGEGFRLVRIQHDF